MVSSTATVCIHRMNQRENHHRYFLLSNCKAKRVESLYSNIFVHVAVPIMVQLEIPKINVSIN